MAPHSSSLECSYPEPSLLHLLSSVNTLSNRISSSWSRDRPWGTEAHRVFKKLSELLVEATRDPRAGEYLAQRISIAIQWGNAASVLGTLPTGIDMDQAPIHIVTGSAGCKEGRDHFNRDPFKWSAFHSQDYGYTKFKAYNNTHIIMEQVSVDLDGAVIDSFWIIKDKLRFDPI